MHNPIPYRVVIIGSGYSIRDNLWNTNIDKLPIWKKIKNEFTIGTNFTYNWFTPTVLMYADYQFYFSQKESLKNIPLILGKTDGAYLRKGAIGVDNNVVLLKECERKQKLIWKEREIGTHAHYWGKDAWTKGWYSSQLIGLKALNMAIALDCKEIYLLGFDAGGDDENRTHFYSDTEKGKYVWNNTKHCGVGKDKKGYYKTGNYNKLEELNKYWFEPFENELKNGVKIYNVSLNSNITTFPKINYKEFYHKLNETQTLNQQDIRKYIKFRLRETNAM